ncbi:MAG: hypothetical protein A3G40_01235 [Deltaproteobacteria bacterium RIFCSPLOWO2_12_FULL_57_22]|nr:MAG: hypothetical protein A3G40_01235 [Deltaproteobacteria bacterium RIFCSPLOWO2_12_FULL_57_22]
MAENIDQGRDIISLFQPDTLLVDTYLETIRAKFHLDPERDLMLAVLRDAVDSFQRNMFYRTEKEKAAFLEAEDWMFEEGSDWVFSFENICETLGIDPHYLRKGLNAWKRRKLHEHPAGVSFQQASREDVSTSGVSDSAFELTGPLD